MQLFIMIKIIIIIYIVTNYEVQTRSILTIDGNTHATLL